MSHISLVSEFSQGDGTEYFFRSEEMKVWFDAVKAGNLEAIGESPSLEFMLDKLATVKTRKQVRALTRRWVTLAEMIHQAQPRYQILSFREMVFEARKLHQEGGLMAISIVVDADLFRHLAAYSKFVHGIEHPMTLQLTQRRDEMSVKDVI